MNTAQFSVRYSKQDVYEDHIISENCVERRNLPGGPAPSAVTKAVDEGHAWLQEIKSRYKQA
jgi:hypothetical protein